MLIDRSEEKFVQTIVFFAHNTNALGKVKLFKLLFLADCEHFKKTGASITSREYQAWQMGPVPVELYAQWDSLRAPLSDAVEIVAEQVYTFTRYCVRAKQEFDATHFTKRELRILRELAEKYRDKTSDEMVEATHSDGGPWDLTWRGGCGRNQIIDYELAVAEDDPHREVVLEAAQFYRSLPVIKAA